MRLKYLEIPSYKNIEDLKLDFSSELITLLVGRNGLGKSNLLEFIAYIFSTIDLAQKEEDFFTLNKNISSKKVFDFIIEYECKASSIFFSVLSKKVEIKIKEKEDKDYNAVSFQYFKKNRIEYTPDYIIGYYSGENSRVKTFFNEHKRKRLLNIRRADNNRNFPALGRMFFTEENCGELLFYTLSTFRNSKDLKSKIDKLLYNYLDIDDRSKIAIAFNNPDFAKDYQEKSIENIVSNLLAKNSQNNFWGITGKIDDLIYALYENNIDEPNSYKDEHENENPDIYEFLFIEDLQYENLINNLPEYLKDPVHFFDILHSAHELGIIYKIYGELVKNGQLLTLNYSELSEGEQQMLTVLGLILITGRDDCLFLFDEPDTHLNPNWQRDLIEHVKEFNINDDNSHIIMATHSPLVVQSAIEKDDVFIFKKGDKGLIEIETFEHKTNNLRIDQVLLTNLFDIESARPKHLDPFMQERMAIIRKGEFSEADKKRLEELENEMGYLPTGETITEIESLILINKLADLKKK